MKRMNSLGTIVLALSIAVAAGACVEQKSSSPTSPSEVSKVLTTGSWASASSSAATAINPGTCGNFEWSISSLTATGVAGTFKAVCGGGMTLQGNATGTLNGTSGTVAASGTATTSTGTCPFTLTATVVPQSLDSVKVTYTGNACGTSLSGTEVLKKP